MTSLEDAFINIAKAEERLLSHNPDFMTIDRDLSTDVDFKEYLLTKGDPNFINQTFAIYAKRMKHFIRDPRLWILLLTPCLTTAIAFILNQVMMEVALSDIPPGFQFILIIINIQTFNMLMIFGFLTSAAIFILTPVQDREFKTRYLLNVNGMSSFSYFLGNLFADLNLIMLPSAFFVIFIYVFPGMDSYKENIAIIIACMSVFCFTLINFTYVWSFAYKSSNSAFRTIGIWYILLGYFVPLIINTVILAIDQDVLKTVIEYALQLDPFLPFANSIFYISIDYYGKRWVPVDEQVQIENPYDVILQ